MTRELNDSLEGLFGGETAPEGQRPMAAHTPVDYQPKAEKAFVEGCPACRGRGRFISYAGRDCGPCFKCKGLGKRTFKTSADTRAKAREAEAARKERIADEALADFAKAHPAVHAWIIESAPTFDFARSMLEAVRKFGSLTDNQMAACERSLAKREAAKVERAARIENAPVADTAGVDRLMAAFDNAKAFTASKAAALSEKGDRTVRLHRNPRITIGGVTISPAKADSVNAGALYVKAGQTYLGKIAKGKFFASRDCNAEDQARVLAFVADPAAAAKAYGQETGVCCVCNATLKSEWRLQGIGPICAQKFGW